MRANTASASPVSRITRAGRTRPAAPLVCGKATRTTSPAWYVVVEGVTGVVLLEEVFHPHANPLPLLVPVVLDDQHNADGLAGRNLRGDFRRQRERAARTHRRLKLKSLH